MPIDYVYKDEKRLVIVVWDQMVDLDQWRANLVRLLNDPDYSRAEAQLVDLRSTTMDASINEAAIHQIIEAITDRRNVLARKRLAMVSGSEWEKPKLFGQLAEALGMHPIVFNNLVTACTWLNLDVVEIGNAIKELRLKMRGE